MAAKALKHGMRSVTGHVTFVDRTSFSIELATILPRLREDIEILTLLRQTGDPNAPIPKFQAFLVRRKIVEDALTWLIANSPVYANITLSRENLDLLPECDEIHCKVQTVLSDFIEDDDLGPAPEQRGAPTEDNGELDVTEVGQYARIIKLPMPNNNCELLSITCSVWRNDTMTILNNLGSYFMTMLMHLNPIFLLYKHKCLNFDKSTGMLFQIGLVFPFFSCQPFPHCSCPLICQMEQRTLERISAALLQDLVPSSFSNIVATY